MVESEPVSSNNVHAVMGSPEIRSVPESLESPDRLVHLFRNGQISFEEYFAKMREHASTIKTSRYGVIDEIHLKREFDIKPTKEETQHAFNLERELTAEYLTSQLTLPQFRFLQDRLYPFTKLDLRALAAELDAREARYAREQFVKRIKAGIGTLFPHRKPQA